MRLNRRSIIRTGLFAALAPALDRLGGPWTVPAGAQEAQQAPKWRHALSLFGDDVKYPADFKNFDYVNPHAPKAGLVRMLAIGTFDNLNYPSCVAPSRAASALLSTR